jgi:ribosomal protein S18 acetylase RimI-like enzyme
LRACAEAAYAPYVPRMGRRPAPMDADFPALVARDHVAVALLDGVPAGYVVAYPRGDHVHVENLAVLPGRQGRGVGGALLDHAEGQARAAGLAAVELYTNAAMVENLSYYPRRGYATTGQRREDGFDRVFFRKELGPG